SNETEHLRGLLGDAENRARELEAKKVEQDWGAATTVIATELRDIRRKIEKLKAMAVPIYWDGFQLPAARWGEYHNMLATNPELYAQVERAYVAANDVNEAVDHRRTVASGKTIGVAPSDPLAAAYEAAGEALDALGQPRGEVWKTEVEKAAE